MNYQRRLGFCLLVVLLLMPALRSAPQVYAQKGQEEPIPSGQETSSLQEADTVQVGTKLSYHWTTGAGFQPRGSSVTIGYLGAGCVYRTSTSANGDENAFTVDLQLPAGSIVYGVRYYGRDLSAQDSSVSLVEYDGTGNFTNIATSSSSGNAGYGNWYTGLAAPFYTVNNAANSLALVWYNSDPSANMALCGARVFYLKPNGTGAVPHANSAATEEIPPVRDDQQAPAAIQFRYANHTAANFQRRNSVTNYQYAGRGCIRSTNGGAFSLDVNLPTGALIYGVRMFYNDTSTTASTSLFLTDYDGSGASTDIQTFSNGSVSAGYGELYTNIATPYTVNQIARSLVLTIVLPADAAVAMCGMRIFYSVNISPSDGIPASSPAGEPVSDPEWSTGAESIGRSNPADPVAASLAADALALDLQQPEAINGLKLRYYYRFIAGSAFQPRYPNTTFTYQSFGCTAVTGGADAPILNVDLHLPDNATLLGARMFYYDTGANNSTLLVTDYNGAGAFNEFIVGSSAGTAGYSDALFSPTTTYVVDNDSKPLALVWNAGGTTNVQRLCGVRVWYSLNIVEPVFLPYSVKGS